MSVTNAVFGPVNAAVAGQIAPRGGAAGFPFEDAVAHYAMIFDADQNNLLKPGLRALDRIGANDGAMNTGIALVANGTTDFVRIPDSLGMNPPDDLSVMIWLRTSGGGTDTLFSKFDTGNDRSWRMQLAANVLRVDLSSNGGGVQKQYSSVQVINDGVLRMYAFVWENATQTLELFIDGALATVVKTTDDALTPSINATAADLMMFAHLATDVPANIAEGELYDAQVWHAAITAAEMKWFFDHPEQLPSDEPSSTLNPANTIGGGDFMSHFKLDEGFGEGGDSPIFDATKNHFDGVNDSNGATWKTDGGFPAPQIINTSYTRRVLGAGFINVPQEGSEPIDAEGNALTRDRFTDFANFAIGGLSTPVIRIPDDVSIQNIFAGGGGVHWWHRMNVFTSTGGILTKAITDLIEGLHQ